MEAPLRFALMTAFHTVIDHDSPADGLSRIHGTALRSGEASRGLGSLRQPRLQVQHALRGGRNRRLWRP